MKTIIALFLFLNCFGLASSQNAPYDSISQIEKNKKLVKGFYEDLWATDNTQNYSKYLADEYVVHDIGERKNVTEPAIEQKIIADRFWDNGTNKVTIDYQIAEGDLVATRWHMAYQPESFFGKVLFGSGSIPIINVFRIQNGKIVEIWNHRHDIDTNQTLRFTLKGLLIGLLIALIPTIWAFRMQKKLKRIKKG
ncbi:ester cyclase [Galbibacter sp. BG1]|uniref:nuclear transport factor 2 family protein n=1 Tax=Galbibacter sp. BG1 TaxID=1170699 RepID=UPI0015B8A1A1|nr:ester cyclase [Galbibacter sp. BG1]QLE01729.1 ester cyclase [Galbibacter sp. BG1]